MEQEVDGYEKKDDITYMWVSFLLLEAQEDYFSYTQNCFWFLNFEADRLKGSENNHPFSMPAKRSQPNLHSP